MPADPKNCFNSLYSAVKTMCRKLGRAYYTDRPRGIVVQRPWNEVA